MSTAIYDPMQRYLLIVNRKEKHCDELSFC